MLYVEYWCDNVPPINFRLLNKHWKQEVEQNIEKLTLGGGTTGNRILEFLVQDNVPRFRKLTSLHLNQSVCTDMELIYILSHYPNLAQLHIMLCPVLTASGIQTILEKYPNILTIHMSNIDRHFKLKDSMNKNCRIKVRNIPFCCVIV